MDQWSEGMIERFSQLQEKLEEFKKRLMIPHAEDDHLELTKVMIESNVIFQVHADKIGKIGKLLFALSVGTGQITNINEWIKSHLNQINQEAETETEAETNSETRIFHIIL